MKIDKIIKLSENYLKEENIEFPSEEVKKRTLELIKSLFIYNILPDKISVSAEGGLALSFINNPNRMYLELYNDNSMGYIIDSLYIPKIIENDDLADIEAAKEKIIEFYE
jgi:hypothetical protein